jgi:3,4-dihydroxy-2-butanone 4-phosphate synthase
MIVDSGLICLPILGERLDQLQIPLMVPKNNEPHRTAFTVSVDYTQGTFSSVWGLTFRQV